MSLWEVEILWARTAGGRRRLGKGGVEKTAPHNNSVVESSLHENEINNNQQASQ